jgi:hypothetical protein
MGCLRFAYDVEYATAPVFLVRSAQQNRFHWLSGDLY